MEDFLQRKLYYTNIEVNYFLKIANFIAKKFKYKNFEKNNFDDQNLKNNFIDKIIIITQDLFSAVNFQNSFIANEVENSYGFLPNIIPISNISRNFFHGKLNKNSAPKNKHIIELAKFIKNYEKNKYSYYDSLKLSEDILDIYRELQINNIDFSKIDEWIEQDLAKHWWEIADFLKKSFEYYQNFLITQNLNSEFENNILEIVKFNKEKIFIFVAIRDFSIDADKIQELLMQENVIAILPAFVDISANITKNYILKNYSKILSNENFKIISLDVDNENYHENENLLDQDFLPKNSIQSTPILLEFDNENIEISYIFEKYLKENDNSQKIALVVSDSVFFEKISILLENLNIEFNSSFGKKYFTDNICDFLIKLMEFKESQGKFKEFISILRVNILCNIEEISLLVKKLSNPEEKFFNNFSDYISNEDDISEDLKNHLLLPLEKYLEFESDSFEENFLYLVKISQAIIHLSSLKNKNILDNEIFANYDKITSFLKDISSIGNFENIKYHDFVQIMLFFFEKSYTKSYDRNAKIDIIKPKELLSISYDKVIICNFNLLEKTDNKIDSWFGEKLLKKLNLESSNSELKIMEYIISILNHQVKNSNLELILTRSKFIKNIITTESPFISEINNLNRQNSSIILLSENADNANNINSGIDIHVHSENLPNILYPSNIEMLLRNPYGFYARKILSLVKYNDYFDETSAADFGNLIHKIIDLKTKNLSLNIHEIFKSELENFKLTDSEKLIWKISSQNLLNDLDKYILLSAKNNDIILSEVDSHMEIFLENSSRKLIIKARIDRLEISEKTLDINNNPKYSKFKIIDFKTGSIPSKKDIFSGTSPQLVISAMIILHGKIDNLDLRKDDNIIIELEYIKLSSRFPYIEKRKISITKDEINDHLAAMTKFLDYYYSNLKFKRVKLPENLRPNYDDYLHFARYENILE